MKLALVKADLQKDNDLATEEKDRFNWDKNLFNGVDHQSKKITT